CLSRIRSVNVVINGYPLRVRRAHTVEEARLWMDAFGSLFDSREVRGGMAWGPRGINDVELASAYTLRDWQRDEAVDREKRRRIKGIVDRMRRLIGDGDCPVAALLDDGVEGRIDGVAVVEVLAGAVLDGICVWLGPPGRGSASWIDAELFHVN